MMRIPLNEVTRELDRLGVRYEVKFNSISGRTLEVQGARDPLTGKRAVYEVPSHASETASIEFDAKWIIKALEDVNKEPTDGFKRRYLRHWVHAVNPYEPDSPPDYHAPDPPDHHEPGRRHHGAEHHGAEHHGAEHHGFEHHGVDDGR